MHRSIDSRLWVLVAAVAAVAMAIGSLLGFQRSGVEGQVSTTLALDVDTGDNLPASVGQIDDCAVLDMGESHDIDIVVLNVDDLLGFELTLRYDPSIIEISADPAPDLRRQFLATASGSRVIDVSEPLPDPDQLHLFGAADIGSDSRESGSGVLARVTLTAKGTGVSPLEIYEKDITGDGRLNFGARLIVSQGTYIGDENGDGYFDGELLHANVAVEADCSPPPPPPDDGEAPPSDGGGSTDGGGSPDGSGSSDGDGSSPAGDDTVLLLPDTPPEISDAIVLGVATAGAEDDASGDGASESGATSGGSGSDDSSDGDAAEGEDDSRDGGSASAGAGDSSSGSGLPLWLVLAITATMLAFGGTVILLALRARG